MKGGGHFNEEAPAVSTLQRMIKKSTLEGLKARGRLGAPSCLGGPAEGQRWERGPDKRGPHLAQRLELGLHDELVFAELAAARVRALDPLLQTGLVHEAQASRAVARRDQGTLVPFTVANPAGAEGQESVLGGGERDAARTSPANLFEDIG